MAHAVRTLKSHRFWLTVAYVAALFLMAHAQS